MFFFFSSRRRHTRYWRDWSSDVCSSDLVLERALPDAFEQGFGLVALGEEPARVGAGDLVDVYGGVYGSGEPFGGHEWDRKSVVLGKSVDLGGRRIIKKKKNKC